MHSPRSRRAPALLLALAVTLAVWFLPGVPADATHGGPWHWAQRNPTVVDGTGHRQTQLANKFAVDNWNAVHADVQLMYRIDSSACGRHARRYEITVCYRQLDHEGGEAWVWADGSDGAYHITSAEVYYNPEARSRAQFSLDGLACHELGHTLGFAHHTDPNEGCMHPATQRDRPGAHDSADLRALYAHTDQYGHAKPGPPPDPDPTPPSERHCLIELANTCWWYQAG